MGNEASNEANEEGGNVLHTLQMNVGAKLDRLQRAMQDTTEAADTRETAKHFLPWKKSHEEQEPRVSPQQAEVVRTTWQLLKSEMAEVGMLTFLHLFDLHPESKDSFKRFRNLSSNELIEEQLFRNHAARVMGVIDKVVDRVHDPSSYDGYLRILGQKHVMYDAQPRFLASMALTFLKAIKPILEKEGAWSDEVSDAWEQLFVVVVFKMRVAMEQEQLRMDAS